MKKNLMLAIVTVMTATVLAGCGTDTASNATNNEPVVEQAAVATDDENIVEDIVEDAVVADEEPAEEPAEVKEEKSGRTLEQYFEENNLKGVFDQEIQATKDSSQNAYKDIEWAIDGNIISYIYTYVTDTAIDEPIIAVTSGIHSGSTAITMQLRVTSFL